MEKVSGKKIIKYQILIVMKESTRMIRKMAMEYLNGSLVMSIKAITKMMKEKDMVKCSGLMGQLIKDSGDKEFNMELVEWSFLIKL